MFIKAKIDEHTGKFYDEVINILENNPLVYLVYYIDFEIGNYITLKDKFSSCEENSDLIYIDSYYEEGDKIYCNIYIDDNIDDYLNWELKNNQDNSFSINNNFIMEISDGGYFILYNVKLLDDIDSIIIQ